LHVPLLILALSAQADLLPFDARVIMLPGVPALPWEGLTDMMLEEMWSLDVTGYQVTLSGWSGYVLLGPRGSETAMSEVSGVLADGPFAPDTSGWARLLQLAWGEGSTPRTVSFPPGTIPDGSLPVRRSALLSGEPDTLVVSAPVEGNVILMTGNHEGLSRGGAWRGMGSEVIPSDWGGVPVFVATDFPGSPGDLDGYLDDPHPYDSVWEAGFGRVLACVDSLLAPLAPQTGASLVWIRGTGGEAFHPWTFIPSPGPPLHCPGPVQPPEAWQPEPRPWTPPPRAMELVLPGVLDGPEAAETTAALLERMTARMVLSDCDSRVAIGGTCIGGGRVALYLENSPWSTPEEALSRITARLAPVAFTSPEQDLLQNCAVRASMRLGRTVERFTPRMAAENTARALGLL
jgi:hypothetical protein